MNHVVYQTKKTNAQTQNSKVEHKVQERTYRTFYDSK